MCLHKYRYLVSKNTHVTLELHTEGNVREAVLFCFALLFIRCRPGKELYRQCTLFIAMGYHKAHIFKGFRSGTFHSLTEIINKIVSTRESRREPLKIKFLKHSESKSWYQSPIVSYHRCMMYHFMKIYKDIIITSRQIVRKIL